MYHRIKTSLFYLSMAALTVLPIGKSQIPVDLDTAKLHTLSASARPQSDLAPKLLNFVNSTEFTDTSKRSGIPEATLQNCSTCAVWASDALQNRCDDFPEDPEYLSGCVCAHNAPTMLQSCFQCIVDFGPLVFDYPNLEKLEQGWSA